MRPRRLRGNPTWELAHAGVATLEEVAEWMQRAEVLRALGAAQVAKPLGVAQVAVEVSVSLRERPKARGPTEPLLSA